MQIESGNWALVPVYDCIYFDKVFWYVQKDGPCALYDNNLVLMFGTTNTGISDSDKTIEARAADYIAQRYDFEGNILVDFAMDDAPNMVYETLLRTRKSTIPIIQFMKLLIV